jgi:UrcA family protein
MSYFARTSSRASTIGGVLALLLMATPTIAQDTQEDVINSTANTGGKTITATMPIEIGDLNLADGRGFPRLYRRVRDAAEKVCNRPGLWSKFDNIEFAQCKNAAITAAMAQAVGRAPGVGAASN